MCEIPSRKFGMNSMALEYSFQEEQAIYAK